MSKNNFNDFSKMNEKEKAISYVNFLINKAQKNRSLNDIPKLQKLIQLLKDKKYGLVWEKHTEEVEKNMKTQVPVFVECKNREICANTKSEKYNFLLQGDNLQSLHLLEKTHTNNIDMIYIDPPYNTGDSLTYNDKRVGANDSYRHSKWLSFMDLRLRIAKNLLNNQGLIFISIDDNEGYNLKILCDEIFGEKNFMGSFSVTKSEGGGQAKYIIKGHDLLLVYAKNLALAKPLARPKDIRGKIFEKDGEQYWIQEDAYRKTFGQYGNLHYEEILKYRDQSFKDSIDKKIKNGEIILINKGKEGHILGKIRKVNDDYSKYYSVLKELNADGKNDLAAFGLEDIFDYPKPVNLIKELISGTAFLRAGRLTVLDFFAGSGTTGQAVLEFIKETGRDINFILCTNNEVSAKQELRFVKAHGYLNNYKPSNQTNDSAIEKRISLELIKNGTTLKKLISDNKDEFESYGICQAVTYPRLKDVISGFDWKHKSNKIIFKKKLTENVLKNMDPIWEEISKIKKKEDYSKYKIRIDESGNLVLSAEVKIGEHYKGIPSNLKYFKTGFVDKLKFPDVSLEYELLNHITPLVELQFGIDITNPKVQIVLNEKQLGLLIEKKQLISNSTLFMSSDIFLDEKQNQLLRDLKIKIQEIPSYFFGKELWSK